MMTKRVGTSAIVALATLTLSGASFTSTAQAAAHAETSAVAQQPSDLCVQKIAVVNNAGFVLNFHVVSRQSQQSPHTANYPINQYRVLDLAETMFTENAEVLPVVKAIAGDTRASDGFVSYCKNGQTATYTVTGTTLNFKVTHIT